MEMYIYGNHSTLKGLKVEGILLPSLYPEMNDSQLIAPFCPYPSYQIA